MNAGLEEPPAGAGASPAERAAAQLTATWGGTADGVWAAPGRVNLIGEHVDYNGGPCLPMALTRTTAAAVRIRDDDRVRLTSDAPDAEPFDGTLTDLGPGAVHGWAAYVAGSLWALRESGVDVPGVDVAVSSDVPLGAGLSSSAALECAVALAAAELAGRSDGAALRRELLAVCVRAENEVVGASTGGMDQTVSLLAQEGAALLIDTRDFSTSPVPLGLVEAGLQLLVIDTRVRHALADGQYGQRRRDCEEAARLLGLHLLGEATGADVDRLTDPRLRARARHVVTEIERVHEVVALVRAGRVAEIGPLLDASHASLREDYEVSSVELDTVVAAATAAGALGARMTGGGFGGSAIALVSDRAVPDVRAAVVAACHERDLTSPATIVVTSGPAARRVS